MNLLGRQPKKPQMADIMAKRKKYQDLAARFLYEHTDMNKTVFRFQKSWKEADKALDTLEQEFQKRFLKKGQKKENTKKE